MPVNSLRQELFSLSAQNFPSKSSFFHLRRLFLLQILLSFLPLNTSEVKGEVVCVIAQWIHFFVFSKWIELQTLLFPFYFNFNENLWKKSPRAGFLIDFGLRLRGIHRTKASYKHETGIMRVKSCVPLFHPAMTLTVWSTYVLDVRKSNSKNNKSQELSFNLKRFFFGTRFQMEWNNKNNNSARLFAQQTQV